MTTPKTDWEKEFGELWSSSFDREGNVNYPEYGLMIAFINTLLTRTAEEAKKEERERIREIVKEMIESNGMYNIGLRDLLSRLEEGEKD